MPGYGERIYYFHGDYGILAGEISYVPTEDEVKARVFEHDTCHIIFPPPSRPTAPRDKWTRALRVYHGIKRGCWCYPDEFLKFEKQRKNRTQALMLRAPEPRAEEVEMKPAAIEPVPPPPSAEELEQMDNLAAPEPEPAKLTTPSPEAPAEEPKEHESAPAAIDTGKPQPKYASVKRGDKKLPKVKLSKVRPSDEVLKTY